MVLICVPSELPGGLDSRVSKSFEDSAVYNFIEVSGPRNSPNIEYSFMRYECGSMACLDPIDAISMKGTKALIVRKIGPNYLLRFTRAGTRIFKSPSGTVEGSARLYAKGKLEEITMAGFSKSAERHMI